MRSRFLFRSFGIAGLLALGGVPSASAQAVPPAPDIAGGTSTVAVPAADDGAPDADAEPGQPAFVAFRMADGRYFHPASGTIAPTEEALRLLVLGESASATGAVVGDASSTDAVTPAAPQVDPLLAAVRRAQDELKAAVEADRAKVPKRIVKEDPGWRDLTLGLWNRSTDQVRYVSLKKKGYGVKPADGVDDDIRVVYDNGVNTEFSVNSGDDIVVALRYSAYQPMNAKGTLFSIEDLVYVPYSRALHTPALVQAGEEYLDGLAKGAFDKLRAERVPSKAFPDRLLADVVDPAMVKSIAAIEHLDEASLQRDTDRALERFFVTIGANRGDSYNYSRSSAGALGMVQFIPSTYLRIAARREWGLEPDFEKGMTSHENAIRAQIIYLDLLVDEFPAGVQKKFDEDPAQADEYVVAAYNGGSGRVRRAIETWQQVFNGEKARQLTALRGQYDTAFAQAESLRKKTLAEKDRKKRATLQKQLDAKRAAYRSYQAQIDRLEASLLRKETIGYVEKYRLTKADERFAPRTSVSSVSAAAAAE